MTKTQLRKRWKKADFLSSLTVPRERAPTEDEVQHLDLRGIPKLANGEPLWHFKLHEVTSTGVDVSFGDGCLIVSDSSVEALGCQEFKFDQASLLYKSQFNTCDFSKTRLRLSARDCHFEKCTFDLSTFAGGFNEYGLTRCTFEACSFRLIRWERTYFKACTFTRCDFSQAQIIDSAVVSFKHEDCANFSRDMFYGDEPVNVIDQQTQIES